MRRRNDDDDDDDDDDDAPRARGNRDAREARRARVARGNRCSIPRRWPVRVAPVRRLKNIGALLERRFQQLYNIVTLNDLVNFVNANAMRVNRAAFERVFANSRAANCVSRWESHGASRQTKYWRHPWPSPPYRNVRRNAALSAGDYRYCVRRVNRCGWETVEAYLRAQRDVEQRRIPAAPQRDGYCRDNAWCKAAPAARRRRSPAAPAARRRSPAARRRRSPAAPAARRRRRLATPPRRASPREWDRDSLDDAE
jgi:hypothetical protein